MTFNDPAVQAVLGGIGAGIAAFLCARQDGGFKRPRVAALIYLACTVYFAHKAREHGPGTWAGLLFAVGVPFTAWWTLRAAVEAWADRQVRASLSAARERAAERRRQRDAVDRALGNGGHP